MSKVPRSVKFLIYVWTVVLCCSCEADVDMDHVDSSVEFRHSALIPLGSIFAGLGKVLENYDTAHNFLETEDTGIVYVYQDSTIISFAPYEFHRLVPVHSSLIRIGNVYPVIPANANTSVSMLDSINFSLNQQPDKEQIDSIKFSKVFLNFIVTGTDFPIPADNLTITLSFPSNSIRMLTAGATTHMIVHPLGYGILNSVELDNFMLYFSKGSGCLPLNIQVAIRNGAMPAVLTQQSALNLNFSFGRMDYEAVYGYLGQNLSNGQVFFNQLDFMKTLPKGLIKVANPQFQISTMSNIGTALNVKVDYIRGLLTTDPAFDPVYLWFDQHTTNSEEEVLRIKPRYPGEWATNYLRTLDKDWGETHHLFDSEKKPDRMEYKITTSVDADLAKNDPNGNFITNNPQIKLKFKATAPLQFNGGSYLQYTDTLPALLNTFNDVTKAFIFDALDSLSLVLNVINGMPVRAKMQLRMLNTQSQEIFTGVKKDIVLNVGEVDANGMVKKGKAAKQIVMVTFGKSELDKIRNTDKIVFDIVFDGQTTNSPIQFTGNDFIDIKAGILLNGKIKSNHSN